MAWEEMVGGVMALGIVGGSIYGAAWGCGSD